MTENLYPREESFLSKLEPHIPFLVGLAILALIFLVSIHVAMVENMAYHL